MKTFTNRQMNMYGNRKGNFIRRTGFCLFLLTVLLLCAAGSARTTSASSETKNGWVGQRYYVNGKAVKGEQKIGKYWYCFNKKTGILQKGWVTHKHLGGDVYYNSKGRRVTGTKKICRVRYKFDPETGVLQGKRFTTGNAVDNLAVKILKKTGYSLKAAYKWSVLEWKKGPASGVNGVAYYAKQGLKKHKGNCYVTAATFCALARQLGYETYQISGYIPSNRGGSYPHSWCEIKIKGKWYVCDPEFEYETGKNGFKIHYGTPGTWKKTNYYRMAN